MQPGPCNCPVAHRVELSPSAVMLMGVSHRSSSCVMFLMLRLTPLTQNGSMRRSRACPITCAATQQPFLRPTAAVLSLPWAGRCSIEVSDIQLCGRRSHVSSACAGTCSIADLHCQVCSSKSSVPSIRIGSSSIASWWYDLCEKEQASWLDHQ